MTPTSPAPLSECDNALIQYLKRTPGTHHVIDVLSIYAWRVGMEDENMSFHLDDIASYLYALCERLDLLGHSLSSFPGGRGGFGVMCDAAPEREWALLLNPGMILTEPTASPDRRYWFRVISVLCSRLYMAEVAKLPGYDHDAVAGPFGAQLASQPRV